MSNQTARLTPHQKCGKIFLLPVRIPDMSQDAIRSSLIEALTAIQCESGGPSLQITGWTCPKADMSNFDSVNVVEASMLMSEQLGIEIPTVFPLTDRRSGRPLNVDEIAMFIYLNPKKKG